MVHTVCGQTDRRTRDWNLILPITYVDDVRWLHIIIERVDGRPAANRRRSWHGGITASNSTALLEAVACLTAGCLVTTPSNRTN